MNRYTQIKEAEYNPLTLQEMMAAPSYLRKQHDDSLAGIAEYQTKLAEVDPLDVHSDLAMQEQEGLYNELDTYANDLSTKGFNNLTKNNLIRFNKKYQGAISPTGILGKINSAKAQFQNEKANYINHAVKMGYSPEQAGANWEKHAQTYNTSFDGKNITNIDSLYAPEYVNAVDEAHKLFKSAGLSETDISGLVSSNLVTTDPNGRYILTKGGERHFSSSNKKQLQNAFDYINNQIMNKNSSTYNSIIHQGKDPNNVLNEVAGLADIYIKEKRGIDRGKRVISNMNWADDKNDSSKLTGGLIELPQRWTGSKLAKYEKSYDNINEVYNNLKSAEQLTPEQNSELGILEEIKSDVENNLKYDTKYQELLKEKENWKTQNANNQTDTYPTGGSSRPNLIENFPKEHELKKIENSYLEDVRFSRSNYTIKATTPKEKSAYNVLNFTIDNAIKGSSNTLNTDGIKITSVTNPEGKEFSNLTPNDRDNLSSLISMSKDIKVVSFSPNDLNGDTMVVIEAIGQGNDYDLDNKTFESGDNIGGKDKPIRLTVSLDSLTGGSNISNFGGAIVEYINNAGGEDGHNIANAMVGNLFLKPYKGKKWSELPERVIKNKSVSNIFMEGYSDLVEEMYDNQELPNSKEVDGNIVLDPSDIEKVKTRLGNKRIIY